MERGTGGEVKKTKVDTHPPALAVGDPYDFQKSPITAFGGIPLQAV
jgi:hypothetical protein